MTMMETTGSQLPPAQLPENMEAASSPVMSAAPPVITTAVAASPSLDRVVSIPSSPLPSSSSSPSAAGISSSVSSPPAPPLKPRRSTTQSSSPRRYEGCVFRQPGSPSTRWRLSYHREGTYSEVYIGHALPPLPSSSPGIVAVKVVKEEGGGNLDAADKRKMLLTEARILHSLQSTDAVCRLYHRPREGEEAVQYLDEDGRERGRQPACIVMSLLLCDLSELKKAGQLSRSAMWEAFLLMLQAMRAVHAGGILHRDVKPSNFGLAYDSHSAAFSSSAPALRAFILDFGQSAYAFEGADSQVPNCPTSFKGKSYFASIARLEGRRQGRSDDVIMLIYIALDFLVGLPWKDTYDRREKLEDRGRDEILRCKREFSAAAADCDGQGQGGERELLRLLTQMEAVPAEDEPPYARMEEELRRVWREEAAKGGNTLQDCVDDFLKQSEREKAAADAEREREREEKERRRKSRRERDSRGQLKDRAKDELTVDTKRAQQQQPAIAPATASPLPSSTTPHSAHAASPLPAESSPLPLPSSSYASSVRSLTSGCDANPTVDLVLSFYAIPSSARTRKAVSALLQHTAPSDLMLQQYQQSVAVFLTQHPSVPSAPSSLFPASLSAQAAPADVFVVMCAEMLRRLRWQTAEEQERPGAALRVVQDVLSAYASLREEKELQRRVQAFLQDRQSGRQAGSGWSSSSTLGGRTLVKKPLAAAAEKDRQPAAPPPPPPPPPPPAPAVRQSDSVVDRWMTQLPKKPLSFSRTALKPASASSLSPSPPAPAPAAAPHPPPLTTASATTSGAAAPTAASASSSPSSSPPRFKSPADAGRRIPRKHVAETAPASTAAPSVPGALSIETEASSASPAVSPRRPSSPPASSPRPRAASSVKAASTPASGSAAAAAPHAPSPSLTPGSASASNVSSPSSTARPSTSAETLAKRAARNASALSKQRKPLTSAMLEMKKRTWTAEGAPAADGRQEAKDDRPQQQEERKDDGDAASRAQTSRARVRKVKKPASRSEDEDGEAEMADAVTEQVSAVKQPSTSSAVSSAPPPARQLDGSARVQRMVREALKNGQNAEDHASAAFQLAEKVRVLWKRRWYEGVVITIDHSADLLRLSREEETEEVLNEATGREEDDFPIRGIPLLLRDYRSPQQLSEHQSFCYLVFFTGFKSADPLWYAESWMRRAGDRREEDADTADGGRKRARGGGRKDGPPEKRQAVEATEKKAEGPAVAELQKTTAAEKKEEEPVAAPAAAEAAPSEKKEADSEPQQQQSAEAALSSSESSRPAPVSPRPHIPRKRSLRSEGPLPTLDASIGTAPQQPQPPAAAADTVTVPTSSSSSSPPEASASSPPPSSLSALFGPLAAAVSGSPPAGLPRKRRKTELSELENDQVSFAFQSAKSSGGDDEAVQALKPALERPASGGSLAGRRARRAGATSPATMDGEQKEEQPNATEETKEEHRPEGKGEEEKQQEVDIMSPIAPAPNARKRQSRRS